MRCTRAASRAAVLLGLTGLLAACGPSPSEPSGDSETTPTTFSEASYPIFPDVEQLARAADVVVVGTVGPVVSREVDLGSTGADEVAADPEVVGPRGIPMVFHSFEVVDLLKGEVVDSEVLSWLDTDATTVSDLSELREGQQVLVFALRRSPGESGITSVQEFLVPLSADNGVFDVAGETVTARSTDVLGLRVGLPLVDGEPLATTLSEVDAVLAP